MEGGGNASMTKPWDDAMKHMAHLSPQALLQWVLPGAVYLGELPLELNLREFDVDLLLKILWDKQEMLLHIEFQTRNDVHMAKRMVRYNVLAHCEHHLPVLSIVIYLFPDGEIPPSPLRRHVPTGQQVLEFCFSSIKLGEISFQDLLALDAVGLLPLIPLTRDGAGREAIQQMLSRLEAFGDTDLLSGRV